MDRVDLFRQLVHDGRDFLEATVSDVTQQQALWAPPGRALPIGAHYAHVLAAQDLGLHGYLLGTTPLALEAWAGQTGMPDLPPGFGQSWDAWGHQEFDIASLRAYARAVYAASDDYFASLDEAAMVRALDLTDAGFGVQDVAFFLINGWITNVNLHCGEIACLKGIQEAAGYPV